jgi:hypothetical protein
MAIAWALVSTEAIKLRRTLALWIVLLTPAIVCAMELVSMLNSDSLPSGNASAAWHDLLLGGWGWWLALIAPMLISFEAAALANLEHGGKLWKQLFAFPIPRWSVYATKMLFCGLLIGVSFLALLLGFVGDVLIVSGVRGWHLASAIPVGELLIVTGKAYLACWSMIAIQSWISARFSGIAAAGIGFAAVVVGFVLGFILGHRGQMSALSSFYPWMLAFRTITFDPRDFHGTLFPAVLGCIGGIVLGATACWDLARRRDEV